MTEFDVRKDNQNFGSNIEEGDHHTHQIPMDQQTQGSNNFTIGQSTAAETFRNEVQPRKFKKLESDFFYQEKILGGQLE